MSACERPPPPAGETRFTNAPSNATSSELRADYLDFSFDYPSNWVVEKTGDASAFFVKVARRAADQKTDLVSLAVAGYRRGDLQAAEAEIRHVAERAKDADLGRSDVEMVGPTEIRVGGRNAELWQISSTAPVYDRANRTLGSAAGEVILVPGSGPLGAVLVVYSSGLDQGGRTFDHLDASGGVAAILGSFRLGR